MDPPEGRLSEPPMVAQPRTRAPWPEGTVTFLFTDIEGSTHLWETYPESMRIALARHDALVRAAIVESNGHVFKTVGDAFCAAFAMAPDALSAGLAAQHALASEPWPEDAPIKARMALHTGAVESRDDDYFGAPLNRAARLLATGHGGQTLLSHATYELVRDSLPAAVALHDLGAHRLKDLARPERVWELRHPGLRHDFPPIRSLSTHPNNLPHQLTSFIGREKEIGEVKTLLAANRLVALTGAGGSGKSRLSLQVAADALERFADGAWFVELASVADPGLVPQTVATVLGVKEEPGKPITDTLIEYLKPKRLLLALDNCEHVLDACASVVGAILRQCPRASILATSREALGISGEHAYRVPSLSLPDRKQVQSPQSLSAYESVRLFIERALLVRDDFQVTNRNAPALASVCCHLDGIPLAIELAAARVRTLSVEEIDGRLDQRFRLLTGGSRTALPRQQTLRSLIDWSYDLLRERERRLLQRLSVFAGGCALRAAESVCAGDGVAGDDVVDLLTSLVDKSLLVAELSGEHSRYTLLETVRQYAREKLSESGGVEDVRRRHRDCYLSLVEEAQPKLKDAEQEQWLQRLELEHENLRAAFECSLDEAASAEALRFCGSLQRFWSVRGYFVEGLSWCDRALSIPGGEQPTRKRADAVHVAGELAYFVCDYSVAQAKFEESLAIRRRLGHGRGIALSLTSLGSVAFEQGDYEGARALNEESLAISRELGEQGLIGWTVRNLGEIASNEGRIADARALLEEGLSIEQQQGNLGGIAASLGNLGSLSFATGQYAAARTLHEQSLAFGRRIGDRIGIATSLANLGHVAIEMDDHATARALHEESLAIQRQLGDWQGIASSLEGLATGISARGKPLVAASIWGLSARLREEYRSPLPGVDRPTHDRRVNAARAACGGDAAFDRAWREGRSLTLEQAVELALGDNNTNRDE